MFLAWSKEPLHPLVLRHVPVYAVNILGAIAFHFGNNAIRSRADLMGIAGRNSNWPFAGKWLDSSGKRDVSTRRDWLLTL